MNEIQTLEGIVYTYNGDIHRPNFVKIQWGNDLVFYFLLKLIDTMYTRFKPDGSLLRVKISLSFVKYISPDYRTKEVSKNYPDISHIVEVFQGESLSQLSIKKWNKPYYYI